MSNLNVRGLDPPTHSHQFDANCGKIRYVSYPANKKINKNITSNKIKHILIENELNKLSEKAEAIPSRFLMAQNVIL